MPRWLNTLLHKGRKADGKLRLSVVLIRYKMDQQIGNTLRSLLPPYQVGIQETDYEVLLMDNGSPERLPEEIQKLAPNVRYHYCPPKEASPNPGVAINHGVRLAKGDIVCLMIDGARMVTPGVLSWGKRLLALAPRSLVEVRGWHLGPKFQPQSIAEGYCHEVEKEMLEQTRWWEDGYKLFDISSASAQTQRGYSCQTYESNCLFMSKRLFHEIGGFDERFNEPGGGFVNLDFFARAAAASSDVFTLAGEGTFHQVHGGAATGQLERDLEVSLKKWAAEAKRLRGSGIPGTDNTRFILAGHMPQPCLNWLAKHVQ